MSIFSFDTLRPLPIPTRAAMLGFALVGIVRVALLLAPGALHYVPQDETRYLTLRNDARLAAEEDAVHTAWILGTSRLTPLDARCVSEPLDVPPETVFNLSAPGMTFWHAARLLRDHPDRTETLRVVVMDLLPFQLQDGEVFPESAPVFIGLSSAAERARIRTARDRWIARANCVFPAWSERRRMEEWAFAAGTLGNGPQARMETFLDYINFDAPGQRAGRAVGEGALAAYAGSGHVSQVQTAAVREILDRLGPDARLVLLWLPVAPLFEEATRDSTTQMFESMRVLREELSAIDDPRLTVFGLDSDDGGSRIEIPSREFTDLVHFSETGLELVCDAIRDVVAAAIR